MQLLLWCKSFWLRRQLYGSLLYDLNPVIISCNGSLVPMLIERSILWSPLSNTSLCTVNWRLIMTKIEWRVVFGGITFLVVQVDTQWERYPNFVMWDYKQPVAIDPTMYHQFDCVVIDPPFVTSEVWANYAEAALLLLKDGGKIILSTIPENAKMLKEMLKVEAQAFQPSIPHLVYQYVFFTNYASTNFSTHNPEIATLSQAWCVYIHSTAFTFPCYIPLARLWLDDTIYAFSRSKVHCSPFNMLYDEVNVYK